LKQLKSSLVAREAVLSISCSFLDQRRYTPAAETAAQLENNPGMKLKTKVKEKFKSRETPLLREVSYMKLKDMT